jgi:hypothetical protein
MFANVRNPGHPVHTSHTVSSLSSPNSPVKARIRSACGASDREPDSRDWVSQNSTAAIRAWLQESLPGDVRRMLARKPLRSAPAGKPLRLCWGAPAVVPVPASRSLWELELLVNIRYDQPLLPVLPRDRFLAATLQVAHKEPVHDSKLEVRRVYDNTLAGDSILPITQPARRLA